MTEQTFNILAFGMPGTWEWIIILVYVAIPVLIACKVCSKAGYHWALGLLMAVPIVNLILLFYIALAEWPIQRELEQLRTAQLPG